MSVFLGIVGAINWLAGVIEAITNLNLGMLFAINGSVLIGSACIVAAVRGSRGPEKPTV